MERVFFFLAALFGFLGVALGAFGTHALKNVLSPDLLNVFEIGVRYQMYHSFALFATAWAVSRFQSILAILAGWLFVIGIVIFSGSLYLLALSGVKLWGAMTPIGGGDLLIAWLLLALGVRKTK